jgi:nucleoid-associated protein EbfC
VAGKDVLRVQTQIVVVLAGVSHGSYFFATLSGREEVVPAMTNLQQILQMSQQMQARLRQLETELTSRTVVCSSGAGMVTVTADGQGKIRAVKIDKTVVDPDDVEMLEDLVLAAVTEAQKRAQSVYEEEMKKVANGMPMPFNFPGLP